MLQFLAFKMMSNKNSVEEVWNAVEERGDREQDEKYSDSDEGE